jgi:hypothetical protein
MAYKMFFSSPIPCTIYIPMSTCFVFHFFQQLLGKVPDDEEAHYYLLSCVQLQAHSPYFVAMYLG